MSVKNGVCIAMTLVVILATIAAGFILKNTMDTSMLIQHEVLTLILYGFCLTIGCLCGSGTPFDLRMLRKYEVVLVIARTSIEEGYGNLLIQRESGEIRYLRFPSKGAVSYLPGYFYKKKGDNLESALDKNMTAKVAKAAS